MSVANTGLGAAGETSQFPASSDGGLVPDFVETARAFLQERPPENAQPMGQRFEVPPSP